MSDGHCQNVVELTSCPICGNKSLSTLETPGRWIGRDVFTSISSELGLKKCRKCALVFTSPRPSGDLLDEFYSGENYDCHRPNHSTSAMLRADFLLSHLESQMHAQAGRRLLDFGAGGGYLLRQAKRSGWKPVGFDVGQAALDSCRSQGLEVTSQLDSLKPGSFDAIVLNHSFEHIEDGCSLLRRLGKLLSPSGRLLVETPNASSLRARLSPGILSRKMNFDERYRAFPIHLYYFTPRTLPMTIAKAGYRIQSVDTVGMGIEELLVKDEADLSAPQGSGCVPAKPSPGRAAGKLKGTIKKIYYNLGLGENIVVVARTDKRV